jgi:hypothetical protein
MFGVRAAHSLSRGFLFYRVAPTRKFIDERLRRARGLEGIVAFLRRVAKALKLMGKPCVECRFPVFAVAF